MELSRLLNDWIDYKIGVKLDIFIYSTKKTSKTLNQHVLNKLKGAWVTWPLDQRYGVRAVGM